MTHTFYYFPRNPEPGKPAGLTVSKTASLPDGDFLLIEYTLGGALLCFVDSQNFTADERQAAYCGFMNSE